MDGNIKLWIRMLGLINIIISLVCIILYILPFFTSVIGGWVGDSSIKSNMYQFLVYFVWRLAIAIVFVASFVLLESGVLGVRFDKRCRKSMITYSVFMIIGLIPIFIFHIFEEHASNPGLFSIPNIFTFVLLICIIYFVFELVFLNDQEISSVFDDRYIKISYWKPIFIIGVVYVFPKVLSLIDRVLFK